MTPPSPTLVERARGAAIAMHGDQLYGDQPYRSHLYAVVQVLRDFGYGDTYVAAGWLHDVCEDTSVSRDDVKRDFGPLVANLVWACTGEGRTRSERNDAIYDKIAAHPSAAVVKVADRVANVEAAQVAPAHMTRYWLEARAFQSRVARRVEDGMQARLNRAYRKPQP